MYRFLKEIGRGKKGARHLSFEEASEAAKLIISGSATEAQIGAFVQAERIKGETTDELLAFIQQCRRESQQIEHSFDNVLDTTGPYDGRSKSFMATIVSSLIVAAAGGKVVMHGSETLPPKYGVVLSDVLKKLQISLETDPSTAKQRLEQIGISALATEAFCPPLARLRPIREQLGIRTLWNTVEKTLNLGNAVYAILGVFHESAMEKAVELQKELQYRRSLVVQGVDGSEDIPIHRISRLCLLDQEHPKETTNPVVTEFRMDPEAFGLKGDKEIPSLTAAEHAEHVLAIVTNQPNPRYEREVLLNGGIKLWLCEKTPDIVSGIKLAKQLLTDGTVMTILRDWQKSFG